MKVRMLLLAATLMTATGAFAQSQPANESRQKPARDQQASSPVPAAKAPTVKRTHRNQAAAKPKKGTPTSEPTRPAKPSIPVAPAAQ